MGKKMAKPGLLAAALVLSLQSTHAWADDRADVRAAVDRWLASINTNDPEAMAANQVARGMTFRQKRDPDGYWKLTNRSNAEWVERARQEKEALHERYWSPTILVHGPIATFWAPYSFDINGKRSHCGVDVFDLVKVEGRWLIANAMWTVEPEGCRRK
jgi:hypothetical protein